MTKARILTWCPDDDGQLLVVRGILRPEDRERQAVFALRHGWIGDRLRADEAIVCVVERDLRARLWGDRVLESQLSRRSFSIWDTVVCEQRFVEDLAGRVGEVLDGCHGDVVRQFDLPCGDCLRKGGCRQEKE
jgi:hypothetical protein